MKLSPKQVRFAQEYLIDLNATRAAIRAGYAQKTARQQGARLLTNVDIQLAIQEAMNGRAERTELTADEVVTEIRRIAMAPETEIKVGDKLVALDMLMRHLWAYGRPPNPEINVTVNVAAVQQGRQELGEWRRERIGRSSGRGKPSNQPADPRGN